MDTELQRVKIAEACGWKRIAVEPEIGIYVDHLWVKDGDEIFKLPDYPRNLNAMHQAEECFRGTPAFDAYIELLLKSSISGAITATAAHRAEAFLIAVGKWEEAA